MLENMMENIQEKDFSEILNLITSRTGIIPLESHKIGIKNYIKKRVFELQLVSDENLAMSEYKNYLLLNFEEVENLINSSTVNETYFFREEGQFLLLKNKILPELHLKTIGQPLKIWSAACSSGEEIYSLLLLAKSMGIRAQCVASDINTQVLKKCAEGSYKQTSVKSVDGKSFKNLLEPYLQEDSSIIFPKEIRQEVDFRKINLSKIFQTQNDEKLPENQNIIFIRNVFIYFDLEMKKKILEKIAQDCLADDGYLFVSINEVAAIEKSIIPKNLEKCVDGKIFYFHKKKMEGE